MPDVSCCSHSTSLSLELRMERMLGAGRVRGPLCEKIAEVPIAGAIRPMYHEISRVIRVELAA